MWNRRIQNVELPRHLFPLTSSFTSSMEKRTLRINESWKLTRNDLFLIQRSHHTKSNYRLWHRQEYNPYKMGQVIASTEQRPNPKYCRSCHKLTRAVKNQTVRNLNFDKKCHRWTKRNRFGRKSILKKMPKFCGFSNEPIGMSRMTKKLMMLSERF